MPDFLNPPTWWIGLANLTQWLYWPAISAILSSVAIFFTIWLADRGRRDARRREGSYLTGVAMLLSQPVAVIRSHAVGLWEGKSALPMTMASDGAMKQSQITEQIDGIKFSDFPDEENLIRFLTARIAVRHLLYILEHATNKKVPADHEKLFDRARQIEGICFYLREGAAKYHPQHRHSVTGHTYFFFEPPSVAEVRRFWQIKRAWPFLG